jgi:hypothetical protein
MSGDVSVDATEQTPIIELKGSGRSYGEHVAVRAIDDVLEAVLLADRIVVLRWRDRGGWRAPRGDERSPR